MQQMRQSLQAIEQLITSVIAFNPRGTLFSLIKRSNWNLD